jgi:hypothetical protein
MHSDVLAWQAFRISLLSPLITGEVNHEDREAYFQKLAKQEHYATALNIFIDPKLMNSIDLSHDNKEVLHDSGRERTKVSGVIVCQYSLLATALNRRRQ